MRSSEQRGPLIINTDEDLAASMEIVAASTEIYTGKPEKRSFVELPDPKVYERNLGETAIDGLFSAYRNVLNTEKAGKKPILSEDARRWAKVNLKHRPLETPKKCWLSHLRALTKKAT